MANVFDFIRARDPRYSNPLFNFLNAGQDRRQNLNNFFGNIGDTMSQFVSPRGRDQIQSFENLHNMVSPIVASGNSIQNMQQGNYGSAFMDVAGFAVPTAIVAKYGGKTAVDAAKYLSETLALSSGGMKNIGENVYEQVIGRMNQPGEMPVVGSNLGNVGHNGGPKFEPDELIPPARPYIQEYSPSYRAATELPQEKGTFEQMRKMMLKQGAKEDELIWSGFDKRFLNQKQVTKQELVDFLHDRTEDNLIEEITDTTEGILGSDSFLTQDQMASQFVDQNLEAETQYYLNEHRQDLANESMGKLEDLEEGQYASVANGYGFPDIYDDPDQMLKWKEYLSEDFAGKDTIVDNDDIMKLFEDEDTFLDYVMNEQQAKDAAEESLREHAQDMDIVDLRNSLGLQGIADVSGENYAPYADYYTPGAIDYSVSRYNFNDPDDLRTRGGDGMYTGDQGGHWQDDDVIVHTRHSLFPLASESGRAYHLGELQSDWSQDVHSRVKEARESVETAKKGKKDLEKKIAEGYMPEHIKIRMGGDFVDSNNQISAAKADELTKDHYDFHQKLFDTQIKEETEFLANPTITKAETDMLGTAGRADQRKNYLANDVGKEFKTQNNLSPEEYIEFKKDVFDYQYSQGKYKDTGLGKRPSQWQLENRDTKEFESFEASNKSILDFLMDENNTSDLAKSYRNKKYTDYSSFQRRGDDTSQTFKEAFDKIRNETQEAQVFRDFNDKLAGGPTVGSTNKWVDFGLKKELRNAINSGAEYFTIGSPRMVREMTGGGEGQEEFYGKIVPGRLKKLIQKFDPNAKVEVIKIQTASDKPISPGSTSDSGVREVLAVKITDDLVNGIADKGGMPIFNFLPGAVGLTGTGILASQAGQEDKPGGLLNQF